MFFLKKLIGQVCIGLTQIYYCYSILLAISKYISVPISNRDEKMNDMKLLLLLEGEKFQGLLGPYFENCCLGGME